MPMQSDDPYRRFQYLQQYIGWTAADAQRVQLVGPSCEPHLRALIDDFYAEIERHPDTRGVITGGTPQVERLKATLLNWLRELFSGDYGSEYATRHWKAGYRHVEIGLSQVYANAALSRLRRGLLRTIEENWEGDRQDLTATLRSVNTLLDLDLTLIQDAYEKAYTSRLMQSERLAAVGQFAGGIAHELRNPLNVVKTSVYYLLHSHSPTPEKVSEHLQRIERQVGLADTVITTVADFAKLSPPDLRPVRVEDCLHETLAAEGPNPQIELSIECPPTVPPILVDANQIQIALGNLIRNARDAMSTGGRLSLIARKTSTGVEIDITDTGDGIAPENIKRIMDPFYSTKTRGIGLGLAITRSIIEKNRGHLRVRSTVGQGTTFTLEMLAANDGQ